MIFGVGIDLIDIERIERAIQKPHFVERIFSEEERENIARKGAQTAAGYWAAKEAIAKAGIDPRNIGSIAISSQRGTFFAIDKEWNPIEDAIVWSDVRATKEAQWVGEHFGIDKYYGIAASAMTP